MRRIAVIKILTSCLFAIVGVPELTGKHCYCAFLKLFLSKSFR